MLSRRNFFKVIPAVGAVSLASVASATSVVPAKWDQTCDVLVVGAGIAGSFAAVAAQEAGAGSVIVLEKNGSAYLNSSTYSNGSANASDTKAQAKAGISDKGNLDNFQKEIIAGGKGTNREEIVSTYAHHAHEAIDWLIDHGAELKVVNNASFPVKRMHINPKGTGAYYIEILEKEGKKLGVRYEFNTKAEALITNPEGSEVIGVKASKSGKPIFIKVAKGVVLATGGIMGKPKLIDEFLLPFKGALSCASPASAGEGLLMAMKIGAGVTHLDQGAVYAYGVPVNKDKRRGLIFRGHVMNMYGGITLGPDGKRFVKDEVNSAEVSNVMVQKGFNKVYAIISQEQLNSFMAKDASQVIGWKQDDFKKELEENKIFAFKANTIAELAAKMKLPVKTVEETVARYNGFVKSGKDEDFNRKFLVGTLEKGPFYGFECQPVAMASMGGLKVNGKAEVLDVYDTPIRHLYAAGEILGGLHGSSYIGGDSVGGALTIGMVAGRNAAKEK